MTSGVGCSCQEGKMDMRKQAAYTGSRLIWVRAVGDMMIWMDPLRVESMLWIIGLLDFWMVWMGLSWVWGFYHFCCCGWF
ncbi:hypothetical protein ASPWEDRAFT_695776 [Aspergillus wentii DTO 134E9]|uniref:Transmembrane protein n=1 Tax=Aspergillus wentii DTO 134E9 TaxID=1073089 RepID=A0A1L9R9E1_ASPWE|nr:uncharacterized protein ASPWEDRAFT_695776 [Aspergillus wentii DTO 134E9]OJJ31536.1 hypothetical protein ASPWEDRAFT_695776 [Aspergillus wentii DTO 134E9]